jgi:hypothetical protein
MYDWNDIEHVCPDCGVTENLSHHLFCPQCRVQLKVLPMKFDPASSILSRHLLAHGDVEIEFQPTENPLIYRNRELDLEIEFFTSREEIENLKILSNRGFPIIRVPGGGWVAVTDPMDVCTNSQDSFKAWLRSIGIQKSVYLPVING